MESPRSSLSLYPAREGAPTTSRVPAGVLYTFLALPVSLVAVTVSLGAWSVAELLSASEEKDLPVAQAVDVCSCCKGARKTQGKEPRPLLRLPLLITQDKVFKRKGLPVRVCKHCDGEVYDDAMQTYKNRA